jgi:hypothetical protein
MAEFMPTDGEEFERGDHHSCAWDGPQTEEHYRINDYLYLGFKHIEVGEGKGLERRTHYIEHSKLQGDVRYKGRRKDGVFLAPGHVWARWGCYRLWERYATKDLT